MSSSGRPPNPFQRLALIIGRLGLHCMRFGQMVGSRIMGGLIQAMRSLLRLRGRCESFCPDHDFPSHCMVVETVCKQS